MSVLARDRSLIVAVVGATGAVGAELLRCLKRRDFPLAELRLFASPRTPIDPATGYNVEETKVMAETQKIFGDGGIRISATCIRVPVLRAHSVAITLTCARPIAPAEVRAILADAPGVLLVDDATDNHFPMPLEASGRDEILVGRIRRDLSQDDGRSIALFAVGDQLLKGAAPNAVQIAERLL